VTVDFPLVDVFHGCPPGAAALYGWDTYFLTDGAFGASQVIAVRDMFRTKGS
jgi:hypothetical protein